MAKKNKEFDDENTPNGNRAINKFRVSDAVMMIIIALLCCTCVMPFIHLAAKSISGNSAVMAKKVFFLPVDINFDAYASIFRDGGMVRSFGYSVVVLAIFTALGMLVCICASYPLSRRRLKGRTWITFVLMFPMYFGAGLIPAYLLMKDLHLLDTMWVLILPLIYSPYNMLIMKTYFQSNIPDSLEEAAFLDGASNFQIILRVVLPLSKAIMATIALFYAVGRWNAYADNKYYIRTDSLKMIQYKLYQMVSSAAESQTVALSEAAAVTSTPEVLQAAAIMFATVPILCIYPFVQKYFVKGTMIGAVKG